MQFWIFKANREDFDPKGIKTKSKLRMAVHKEKQRPQESLFCQTVEPADALRFWVAVFRFQAGVPDPSPELFS